LSRDDDRLKQAARSDEELVAGIRRASEGDFTTLYERYYQRVYNFTYLRLRNHADTEEAVQEIFTAVFRSIEGYRGTSSVLSWIYGIAKNTVNNHIRRSAAGTRRVNRAEAELVRDLQGRWGSTPEDDLRLRRCAESVEHRLAGLSDWQLEIFELRHVENLPISEICRRTERSSDSVRSSLSRVKRAFVDAVDSGVAIGAHAGRALA